MKNQSAAKVASKATKEALLAVCKVCGLEIILDFETWRHFENGRLHEARPAEGSERKGRVLR